MWKDSLSQFCFCPLWRQVLPSVSWGDWKPIFERSEDKNLRNCWGRTLCPVTPLQLILGSNLWEWCQTRSATHDLKHDPLHGSFSYFASFTGGRRIVFWGFPAQRGRLVCRTPSLCRWHERMVGLQKRAGQSSSQSDDGQSWSRTRQQGSSEEQSLWTASLSVVCIF